MIKEIKTLQLISPIGFFGAENVMIQLSKELFSCDYSNYVGILGNSQRSYIDTADEAGKYGLNVKIFPCRGKFDIKSILKIRNFIKNNKIDIIHSHGYKSNLYNLLASIGLRVKRITTCHNWLGSTAKMRFYAYLDKLLLNKFDKVIVVSNDLNAEVLKRGISPKKVQLIYNGIDLKRFQPDNLNNISFKELLGFQDGSPLIGTVGRLTEEKGHNYLISAFANMISELPDAKLLIVGDGPLRNSMESQVKNLGLQNKVILMGTRRDIPEILNIIDIFVLPSLTEGVPMALLEAMAAKKPIIATRVGAISNIIKNGYSGLLVEPKDSNALYCSMNCLINDKAKAFSMANEAFECVKSKFSSLRMAQEYINVYESLNQLK